MPKKRKNPRAGGAPQPNYWGAGYTIPPNPGPYPPDLRNLWNYLNSGGDINAAYAEALGYGNQKTTTTKTPPLASGVTGTYAPGGGHIYGGYGTSTEDIAPDAKFQFGTPESQWDYALGQYGQYNQYGDWVKGANPYGMSELNMANPKMFEQGGYNAYGQPFGTPGPYGQSGGIRSFSGSASQRAPFTSDELNKMLTDTQDQLAKLKSMKWPKGDLNSGRRQRQIALLTKRAGILAQAGGSANTGAGTSPNWYGQLVNFNVG